ncbi:MAG: hypothetical protein ACI8PP_001493 [Candidatus Pseudothioglobus sp.]
MASIVDTPRTGKKVSNTMLKKLIQRPLKFLFVDSTVNILGDLFEQPLVMWAFIGWGWIAMLVMGASIISQIAALQ